MDRLDLVLSVNISKEKTSEKKLCKKNAKGKMDQQNVQLQLPTATVVARGAFGFSFFAQLNDVLEFWTPTLPIHLAKKGKWNM